MAHRQSVFKGRYSLLVSFFAGTAITATALTAIHRTDVASIQSSPAHGDAVLLAVDPTGARLPQSTFQQTRPVSNPQQLQVPQPQQTRPVFVTEQVFRPAPRPAPQQNRPAR